MRFSAATGTGRGYPLRPGPLYLPNAVFLSTSLTNGLFSDVVLTIPGLTSWSPASLVMDDCIVRLGNAPFQLSVAGGVTIDSGAKLVLPPGSTFTCNDLTLTNGGVLTMYSDSTNWLGKTYSAELDVTDTVTIGAGSWVHPYSDLTGGSSVRLAMNDLYVAAGGGINADSKGYRGVDMYAVLQSAGPGRGFGMQPRGGGAGHGGGGGRIALYYQRFDNPCALSVNKGIAVGDGSRDGQPGTVYEERVASSGTLFSIR